MTEKKTLEQRALDYHQNEVPGKLAISLTKSASTQEDLTLAYSPGVAFPCLHIEKNEEDSYLYTGKGNLVAVISNGTAVLGLGDIGAAASKPVMEGKAMLFKKFANIDVFDLELNIKDSDKFIDAVAAMEPTFGGINLEDIKAPECFYIEEKLRERMNIPVFHDDQHGTAIVAGAAFLNALEIANKKIEEVKVVFSGAGASAIACANIFLSLGVKIENLTLCDSKGVVHTERTDLNQFKLKFVKKTEKRSLKEALDGADAFIGVSVAKAVTPDMIMKMNDTPIIFAMANPEPEIRPEDALKVRPDAILATGRSDYPNQVNNVLGFPFIFRGALDVRAKVINEEMKLAAVYALSKLAKESVPASVMKAYKAEEVFSFGKNYLLPKPVDPRVLFYVAPAVAKAAMDSGVAKKIINIEDYIQEIEKLLSPTQNLKRNVERSVRAKITDKKPLIVLPHSYDERVLRASAQVVEEGLIDIALIGHEERTLINLDKYGLISLKDKIKIIAPISSDRFNFYAEELFKERQRKGVTYTGARQLLHNYHYFAAMMLKTGDADGVVSGLVEPYGQSIRPLLQVVGTENWSALAGVYMVMQNKRKLFFSDCAIHENPDSEMLAEIVMSTVNVAKNNTNEKIRVAMLSFSSFGSVDSVSSKKMSKALSIVNEKDPELEIDGEMQVDVALNKEIREREYSFSKLTGDANVLIFPDLNSANIAYKMLTQIGGAEVVGPLLTGMKKSANVMQMSATTDELVNMIYLTAEDSLRKFKK